MLSVAANTFSFFLAGAVYAPNQQSVSGGSTPVPSINPGFGAPAPPSGNFGSSGNVSSLEIGPLSTGKLFANKSVRSSAVFFCAVFVDLKPFVAYYNNHCNCMKAINLTFCLFIRFNEF